MDAAFNQHQARRKSRSTTNLNHLSLAPLTSKLPLGDDVPPLADGAGSDASRHGGHHYRHSTSYLQGKSAPTTPGILERSPARSGSHARLSSLALDHLPKRSKSTTHLARHAHGSRRRHHSPASGHAAAGRQRRRHDEGGGLAAGDRNDGDWLLRAGALISSETRESKGQSWLVSRASSTSLAGMQPGSRDGDGGDGDDDDDDDDGAGPGDEREPWASHHNSRRGSRRGSLAFAEDELPSAASSAPGSRLDSRSHSRAAGRRSGSRSQAPTPLERHASHPEGGYFSAQHHHRGGGQHDEHGARPPPGPDFVNLDEKLEAVSSAEAARDTSREDEAHVRRLVRSGGAGAGTWLGGVLGWRLFAVEEDDDEAEEEDGEGGEDGSSGSGSGSGSGSESESEPPSSGDEAAGGARPRFEGAAAPAPDPRIPPPRADEGGWKDAAWLLSVASKVLL